MLKTLQMKFYQALRNKRVIFTMLFLGFMGAFLFNSPYQIVLNKTPSLEDKFFIINKHFKNEDLKTNKVLYFSLPKETPYYKKGESFGKILKCQKGQTLATKHLSYYCDGVFLGKAKTTDINGKNVENFIFNGTILCNQFFVMGTHERSFDSRYWGFVNKEDIKGVAIW